MTTTTMIKICALLACVASVHAAGMRRAGPSVERKRTTGMMEIMSTGSVPLDGIKMTYRKAADTSAQEYECESRIEFRQGYLHNRMDCGAEDAGQNAGTPPRSHVPIFTDLSSFVQSVYYSEKNEFAVVEIQSVDFSNRDDKEEEGIGRDYSAYARTNIEVNAIRTSCLYLNGAAIAGEVVIAFSDSGRNGCDLTGGQYEAKASSDLPDGFYPTRFMTVLEFAEISTNIMDHHNARYESDRVFTGDPVFSDSDGGDNAGGELSQAVLYGKEANGFTEENGFSYRISFGNLRVFGTNHLQGFKVTASDSLMHFGTDKDGDNEFNYISFSVHETIINEEHGAVAFRGVSVDFTELDSSNTATGVPGFSSYDYDLFRKDSGGGDFPVERCFLIKSMGLSANGLSAFTTEGSAFMFMYVGPDNTGARCETYIGTAIDSSDGSIDDSAYKGVNAKMRVQGMTMLDISKAVRQSELKYKFSSLQKEGRLKKNRGTLHSNYDLDNNGFDVYLDLQATDLWENSGLPTTDSGLNPGSGPQMCDIKLDFTERYEIKQEIDCNLNGIFSELVGHVTKVSAAPMYKEWAQMLYIDVVWTSKSGKGETSDSYEQDITNDYALGGLMYQACIVVMNVAYDTSTGIKIQLDADNYKTVYPQVDSQVYVYQETTGACVPGQQEQFGATPGFPMNGMPWHNIAEVAMTHEAYHHDVPLNAKWSSEAFSGKSRGIRSAPTEDHFMVEFKDGFVHYRYDSNDNDMYTDYKMMITDVVVDVRSTTPFVLMESKVIDWSAGFDYNENDYSNYRNGGGISYDIPGDTEGFFCSVYEEDHSGQADTIRNGDIGDYAGLGAPTLMVSRLRSGGNGGNDQCTVASTYTNSGQGLIAPIVMEQPGDFGSERHQNKDGLTVNRWAEIASNIFNSQHAEFDLPVKKGKGTRKYWSWSLSPTYKLNFEEMRRRSLLAGGAIPSCYQHQYFSGSTIGLKVDCDMDYDYNTHTFEITEVERLAHRGALENDIQDLARPHHGKQSGFAYVVVTGQQDDFRVGDDDDYKGSVNSEYTAYVSDDFSDDFVKIPARPFSRQVCFLYTMTSESNTLQRAVLDSALGSAGAFTSCRHMVAPMLDAMTDIPARRLLAAPSITPYFTDFVGLSLDDVYERALHGLAMHNSAPKILGDKGLNLFADMTSGQNEDGNVRGNFEEGPSAGCEDKSASDALRILRFLPDFTFRYEKACNYREQNAGQTFLGAFLDGFNGQSAISGFVNKVDVLPKKQQVLIEVVLQNYDNMGDYTEGSYGSSYTSLTDAGARFGCILIGRNLDYFDDSGAGPTGEIPHLTVLMDLSDKRCGGHGPFLKASSIGDNSGNWASDLNDIVWDILPSSDVYAELGSNPEERRDNFDTFFDRIVTVAKNHAYAQRTSALEQTV